MHAYAEKGRKETSGLVVDMVSEVLIFAKKALCLLSSTCIAR